MSRIGWAVILALGAAGSGAAQAPSVPVRMGVAVRPDTTTVGTPFVVTVRVRAPLGAVIHFPVPPDSGGSVEAVDPPLVRPAADSTAVDQTATYRLVAWDTGALSARLGSVGVGIGGAEQRYVIGGDTVRVRSVLPADTSLRHPKGQRDIMLAGIPWWVYLLALLAAAALISLFIWWWVRRRRRREMPRDIDALAAAHSEFARIAALGLLEAGERGRYVALHVDVLRDYLAARLRPAVRALTSTELLAALRDVVVVPDARLAALLAESDLIKFARRPVTADRARALGSEARALVDDVDRAIVAERERAAQERAA